jgi:hypothetical protein
MRFFKTSSLLLVLGFVVSCENKDIRNSNIVSEEPTTEEKLLAQKAEDSTINKFEWQEGLCDYTGYYQNNKVSEKQVKDTYFLIFEHNSALTSDTDATLDKPEYYSVAYIENSLRKLDNNYNTAIKKIQSLDVIPSKFWQEHKKKSVLQLEELHQLERLTLKAHLNPKLLIGTHYSNKCIDYVNALTSGDTTVLLDAWKKLNENNKLNNGYPEMVELKYQEQLKSNDRLLFARINLMTYGWWNCANRQRKYVDGFNQGGQVTKEFDKLFDRVVVSNCVE